LLRANLPVAMASTLVTNPVTFGPVYYGAYQLGKWVLLEPAPSAQDLEKLLTTQQQQAQATTDLSLWDSLAEGWKQLGSVGKPLVTGLAIIASLTGVSAYFLISGIWALKIRWSRRRRLQVRSRRLPS
jgi:uncharacterized protein